ncbi:MAG: hypothetical protein KKE23_01295 [Nanoarchaeota archaeon]|nr:hypothetical protein [Nanoarchaeota archaeon]
MKKIFSGIVSVLSLLPLVSAQSFPAPPIAFNGLTDMFNVLLNNASAGSYSDIVARLLIFVLLAVVLYAPAKKIVSGNEKVGALISSIIAIMAIRFMTPEMVAGMFLPYQALGVVLSILIPFILFEFFMLGFGEDFPPTFRTIGYVMLAGIFTMMWWFRWTDIGDLAYYYLGATVLCLIALSLDQKFREWRMVNRIGSAKKRAAYHSIIALEKELKQAIDNFGSAAANNDKVGMDFAKQEIKDKEKAIREVSNL